MSLDLDEFHLCPACGQLSRHRVSRDRKLAPVLWCQNCFHVSIEAPADKAQAKPRSSRHGHHHDHSRAA